MTKAEEIIKNLEEGLVVYEDQLKDMDLEKADDARKVFARMAFYNAQANVYLFKRLDEIEAKLDELKASATNQ